MLPAYDCRDGPAQKRRTVVGWLYLLVAGLLEVGWAVGLKHLENGILRCRRH
jgi:hypothetical protein